MMARKGVYILPAAPRDADAWQPLRKGTSGVKLLQSQDPVQK